MKMRAVVPCKGFEQVIVASEVERAGCSVVDCDKESLTIESPDTIKYRVAELSAKMAVESWWMWIERAPLLTTVGL